jgi:hypothetical protein
MEEEEMATEQKDAPSAQIESELAPPVAFTIIHSDDSAAETHEPPSLSDVEGALDIEAAPDVEGAPDVEPDQAETNGASAAEFQQDETPSEDRVADGPTAAVHELGAAFERDFAAVRDRMVAVNVKVLQAFLTNAEMNLDFLAALPSVRSLSELIALQSKFASKQVDAMVRPAAEIGVMTQNTMASAVDAMRNQTARSVRN